MTLAILKHVRLNLIPEGEGGRGPALLLVLAITLCGGTVGPDITSPRTAPLTLATIVVHRCTLVVYTQFINVRAPHPLEKDTTNSTAAIGLVR